MNRRDEHHANGGEHKPALHRLRQQENDRCGRHVARIQILIHDVERGSSDGNCEQCSHQSHASPGRALIAEANARDAPASQQKKKDTGEVPEEDRPIQRQMGDAHRGGNDVGKQRHARVRHEVLVVEGIERGMEMLDDAGEIELGVFNAGVVAMHEHGADADEEQQSDLPAAQSRPSRILIRGAGILPDRGGRHCWRG